MIPDAISTSLRRSERRLIVWRSSDQIRREFNRHMETGGAIFRVRQRKLYYLCVAARFGLWSDVSNLSLLPRIRCVVVIPNLELVALVQRRNLRRLQLADLDLQRIVLYHVNRAVLPLWIIEFALADENLLHESVHCALQLHAIAANLLLPVFELCLVVLFLADFELLLSIDHVGFGFIDFALVCSAFGLGIK